MLRYFASRVEEWEHMVKSTSHCTEKLAWMRAAALCLCLIASTVTSAQRVTVIDAETGASLPGATLQQAASGANAVTDAHGKADLAGFDATDSIAFRTIGYTTRVLSVREVQQSGYKVGLVRQALALDAFVVSANRWEQDPARVPDQITVISKRDAAFANPGTAADLLQQSGEVFMQRSQLGGGSPMLRGFAANRVLIVVDGVRMNNAIYRAGNLQNVISVDAQALERAEVVHGPGAMTYGSDAIGGIMDFHLLRPRFSSEDDLNVSGGAGARYGTAANEYGGHVHLGVGLRKVAVLGSASFTRFGDLRMGTIGPKDYQRPWYAQAFNGVDSMVMNSDPDLQVGSGYDNINLMGKLAYKPVEQLELGFNYYFSTTSDVPRYDRLIEVRPNGLPRSAEWYYGPQEWRMASFTAKHTAERGPWSKARLAAAWQDYGESRHDRNFRNVNLRSQTERVNGLWLNLDMEKELNTRTQVLFGAEYVSNAVESKGKRVNQTTGAETIINSRYPDGSEWSTASVYAGAMHEATERLTISGGGRYNWSALEARFDTSLFAYPVTSTTLSNSALTGNAGLAWRPGTGWKLSLDLSTGFRAPNIDDIGKVFDSEPGAVIVPNPELKPEYAYSMEAGVEKTFKEKVRVRVNAYHVLLDDAMVRRPFAMNGADSIEYEGEPSRVEAIQNAAQARVIGFTLGIDAKLFKYTCAFVRYNWQDGVEQDDVSTTDVPLRHAPPPFGQAGLTFERKKLRVQFFAQFSGGFAFDDLPPSEQAKLPIYALDAQGKPHAPAWHTLNVRGSYQITKALLATLGVENITDQRYRPYSSGITAPGRNVMVALRASF